MGVEEPPWIVTTTSVVDIQRTLERPKRWSNATRSSQEQLHKTMLRWHEASARHHYLNCRSTSHVRHTELVSEKRDEATQGGSARDRATTHEAVLHELG